MSKNFEKLKKLYGEDFAKICEIIYPDLLNSDEDLPASIMNQLTPSSILQSTLSYLSEIKKFDEFKHMSNKKYKQYTRIFSKPFDRSRINGQASFVFNSNQFSRKFWINNYGYSGNWYCSDNIIVRDNEIEYYDCNRYEIIDSLIIDKQRKIIYSPFSDNPLANTLQDIETFEKIEVEKIKDSDGKRRITITIKDGFQIIITTNKRNQMISYADNITEHLEGDMFSEHEEIKEISLTALSSCSDNCFHWLENLSTLNLPALTSCGNDCFGCLENLSVLNLPALTSCGANCFWDLDNLSILNLPAITSCGEGCITNLGNLTELNAPSLRSFGEECFDGCYNNLSKVDFTSLPPNMIKQLPQRMQKLIKQNQEQSK